MCSIIQNIGLKDVDTDLYRHVDSSTGLRKILKHTLTLSQQGDTVHSTARFVVMTNQGDAEPSYFTDINDAIREYNSIN